nr:MAG TPA: Chromatin remodeling complex ATPase [Caudoviricetes sp.]
MPLDNSKLKKVYATLQQGGYKQDYKTFLKGFTGNDHYENRKKVYDLLSANGARIGSSYEEFMKKMQVAPAPAKSTPTKPKGTPITEAYRQKVLANVGNMMAETNASIQRTQNRMDYAIANAGLRVPRVTIGDKNSGVRLGQNTKVVAKKPQYNPKSGKMEQTYITESGNEFTDRGAADLEQNTIDAYKDSMSVSGQLRDAYAERDRLDEAMKKRMKEIDERPNQRFNDFMRESAAAMTPGAGPAGELEARMSKYDNDDEYLQLMAAARKNHQTIQLLEDKKNNQMNSFWHSLGTTALNGYTFTDGMSEMRDATALTRASKHIDSINRKRAAGKPLTRGEQTAEAVLKNFATDNAVQGMYGGDYGAWARAGGMTANSLDFMKDLMLNPGAGSMAKGIMRGTAKGMAKGLAKVTGKEAAQLWKNNVARRTLKATGVLIGAHMAGAYVSNTTGIGRTAATMGTLALGKVGVDDNGNYTVENAMGLLPAFAEAERQQARENGSEMFGEFIPGVGGMVKKGLEKIGLSKLSGAMTNIGNKEWYKQYSRLLESGGYNGLPGEALEEYEGSLFDALTGHAGDAWDDMTNLQNHVDIWLGCATMGALLGSVPMMMQGHHTAQYYRYKHNTDKADNLASFRMTAERWAPLRDKIDNTDNSKMADVVTGIINNPDLHPEEKKAALNYVRNLTMMRGYNIAQVNNASDDEEQRPEVQSVNDNYSKGYDTTEPQAMNDAKNLLDMKREQVAKEHGIENVDEVDALIGDDPLRYIEEQKQLGNTDKLQSVIDYANAKSAYDGMVQRVQDDIDSRIEESNATVDSRVNRRDGMIHHASLKLKNEDGTDKKVYVVSGNVVMFNDGKGVDRKKSDNTIVIRDVETGEMKVIPPDLIRGLDAAVDPEEEKARAREAIIEEMSQTAANNVDGVVTFNEGDTYTLTEENGEQTQVTLVANEQGLVDNGDGTVNVTVDGQTVVPMSMENIQSGVDATNMARTMQAEVERQANDKSVSNSEERVQNDGESVEEKPDGVQYGVNDTFTLLNGEDKIIHGEVQGVSDDGVEIRTDEPLNGKYVQVIPAEEFENNVESINDADGNQVWAREYAEDAAATEEVSDSTEPLDPDLVAPATPTTEELVQMARGGNELAQHQLEAQGVQWKEAIEQQTALSRVPINEETGEPMFERADRETALDALNEVTGGNEANTTAIVNAQVEQAQKTLDALKKKQPTKKAPSLKGSPMAMVKAQQEADANYNAAMEQYNAQVGAAEENLNAWTRIYTLMNDRKRSVREQQEAAQRERDAKLHDEAVAQLEEQKRMAAEKAAEQAEVGTHAVNPKIKAKWDGAAKVEGNPNALTLADGSTIRGHYVLTEAGAATASHDVNNAYEPAEGFPVDENGESVNDRDYKRDRDAQRIVQDIADNYDSRALQSPVIVSKDGVVLSGNNRTMSGEIAAKNGTDKAYVDHLREFGAMFGFTPEQIEGMQHPRVVFVPDEELPYDANTFARFNAEQQKKQSKPEHAVKLGKIVPDNVFASIVGDISRFDRMSDYYADGNAVSSAIGQLLEAGVINEMQLPELRTGNALSAAGKELIENTLIGKVFQASPDAVRQIISTPTLRQSVVMGLNEIANNRTLAKSGYDLSQELGAAVDLVSRAKAESPEIYKEGMPVSSYGRQQGLFDDEYGDSRVTDGVTLLLADLLNSGKPSDLRKVLSTYNNEAASPASGQIDMFSGDVTSREDVLNNVLNYFRNATPREQQAIVDAAVAERKRRAEAEPVEGSQGSEQTENAVRGSEETKVGKLSVNDGRGDKGRIGEWQGDLEKTEESSELDDNGIPFVKSSNGTTIFGEIRDDSGLTPAPIKLSEGFQDENGKGYGLVHIEAGHGSQIRNAGFKSVEDFVSFIAQNYDEDNIRVGKRRANGNTTYLIQVSDEHDNTLFIEMSRDNSYWNVNSAGIFRKGYSNKKETVAKTEPQQPNNAISSDSSLSDGKHNGIMPSEPNGESTVSSVSKVINNQSTLQGNAEKSVGGEGETSLSEQIATASAEVNTAPTEAQKEAGNYKKGHVQVGTFDITIEQPQGSVRKGTDADGKQWESKMHNTYGYIRGAVGVDGDHIDVFLSNDIDGWNGHKVFVVDQYNPDGTFDEHKVMLGFNDADEAKSDYLANYEKGWEYGRRIDVSAVNLEGFEKWIESSKRKTKPFGEYASVKKDVVEVNAPKVGYSITPSTYTNKKGKTSNVSLLTFDNDLTADQERAVKEFAKERTGEGRFAPARGWKDRESGGWIFRNEEDARKAVEMVGNEEAVADNQPMTAQELRDAVEPKKPTASKKTAAKKPANRVEVADVVEQKPSEPTKAEQPKQDGEKKLVITDEMKHDEDILRELLGIGDEELDGGIKFRDPDAMTSQQRRFVYNAGVNYSLGYIDQGFVAFPEFAKAMVGRLGYKIKPWLKSFYEGAKRIPGYDQAMFTPTEEVDAFDVENFDKPNKDVMAQAKMIVEEGKAQVAAAKANNELKATRNEQRKEADEQRAADTAAVAEKARIDISQAETDEAYATDGRGLSEATERVDDTLGDVNDQLALLGYYAADREEKDYNKAYGYMRNAEKKAVKDAAELAEFLLEDLGLDYYAATHAPSLRGGTMKKKPLAVANIAPVGGDITIHLPLNEGHELYINIALHPTSGKGKDTTGDDLEVDGIMYRVEGDKYSDNHWAGADVTYAELLKGIERVAYKYLPGKSEAKEGEYYSGDKVEYSPDDGRTWHDAVVVQPNDEGGVRIDTGQAPVMYVNAHLDQLRHKAEARKDEDIFQKAERIASESRDKRAKSNVEKLKPIGKGSFGDVYNQFQGNAQEAFAFLKEKRSGDVLGVFRRDGVGDIDVVWGDKGGGLSHIIDKHVGEGKSFSSVDEAAKVIDSIIKTGDKDFENGDKIVFKKGSKLVTIRKNVRDKGKKIADKNWILTAYDELSADGDVSAIAPNNQGQAARTTDNSRGKGIGNSQNNQENQKEKTTKKVKPEQQVGDLFAGLFDKSSDNGLQGNDASIRTEAVPADHSGQRQGLRGSQGNSRKTVAQEGGRSDGGRGGQSTGKDRAVSAGLHGLTEPKNTRNNHSERGADHAPTSVNGRIEANIKAIELAHELLESGETATPEQMSVLRQFSGWGGLGAAFSDGGYDWKQRERNKKIRELLGEEAYEQAVMSANSAYYTPAYVVDTLWDIANQLGFKGGNILEGSAGIGNILGQMPTMVSERSNIHAIEIDGTSGGILSLLYPDAKVEIQGFEQTRIPNGSVDLAITNVPFVTGLRVNDTTGDSDLSKKFHNIHDFCIAKNVRKLREGGLGIFISSNGTLDNSKALRDWVVNEGGSDFIGAFRMNNKTFGGTTVTSDIIVIRKRVNGQKSAQAIDVSSISGERTAEYEEPGARKAKQLSMDYNKYFIEHPDHMAGEMRFAFETGDTFRPTSKGLYPVSGKDQGKILADFVKSFTEEERGSAETTESDKPVYVNDASADGKKLGEMYLKDGKLVTAGMGGYYPLEVNEKKIKGHTKQECFTAYAAIKDALAEVMQYQTENEGDEGLKPLIAKLNKAYDVFVSTYGHFNKNNQLAWLRNDVDYPNVFSLETYKEQGDGKGGVVKTYDKADVMKGRVVEKESEPHPENVNDGVVVSMFKNGRIDVPYIASQLGKSEAEVKREIIDCGLGFEDPATRQMEVSYQYLSGNVREKLKQAEANNENGEYSKNIKALQDVVPMNIPAHLIDFTLGSSWLDPKLYDAYVKERTDIDVHFTAAGGTWFMKAPTYGVNVEKNRAMGIVSEKLKKTIMGHELISAAIQNKSIVVSRTEKHFDGTTETVTDREATAACAAKIDEIRQDFKDWVRGKMQRDADLSARMEQAYNDRFNNYVPMSIPDDFVPEYFGGATHKFKMRSHQGKAIVRGTMQPLLLAHEVGTGKTFTLISTAMEMRRLGTARKPMIVVQNATVGQFAASAKELYPNAKVLVLDDNDRDAEGRKNFYAKIKYNDWDMVIIPQSTLDKIPDSDERQMQFKQDKIDEKMLVLEQMREADSSGRDPITRRAEKELADLQAEMAALTEGISKKRTANDEKKKAVAKQNAAVKAEEMLDRRTDDVENFDDMGIDALLIDEAHEYKHLGFATAMQRGVKGVDPSYSKKSQGVYLKTQAVLEKNNGRNVIFATGTPISNTAAEIWTFMRYLMPKDTMKEYGIYYFDDFVRNFGNLQQMMEFKTNGKFQEVNRFAGYVNLPELVRIWSGVADTALTKDQTELVKKIPEMEGGKAQDIYLPQTRALRSVMKYVREELERFDQMSGKEKKENSSIPLTMYGIAQGAAVDARLVEMHAEDDPRSKTNEAVRQTLRSLKETDDYKGTVAIFADHYQNKRSGFNLYEDIKKKLIQQGVPASEIVVMKSGMKIKQKLEIFDKVNRGEVRVILGSTATLGTGVNIQERLHTLIHLDAPNRPMDYTQRNGRILRQGNLHKEWNKPVRVLRFGVEDSLDVTAYQRLKTKGAIADSVMESDRLMQDSMNNRVLEEEEDVFGDTVAQLSGSEYALLKNNAEKNVRKYESRRKQWEADQTYIHNVKPKLEGQIKAAAQRAEEANAHLLAVQKAFPDGKFTEITVGKLKFASVDAMTDFIKDHNRKILDAVKAMKENPGNKAQTHTLTLSLGGYDFVVKTEMSRETVNNGGLLFAEIHRKMSYSCPELGLNDVPVKQSLLRNAVEDITENVITGKDFAERFDIATRMVQHGKSELEQLKQREGKPFEFSKELEEAKRQFEEYSEAMKVEMAEKEKKYAEMDASVEAASDVVIDDEGEDSSKHRMLDDDAPNVMENDSNAMVDRVTELSERLHTPVRIIRTEEEVAALPSARQRRMKGSFNPLTGEVTIVVPNNANMADIENTFVHEVVGHDGLRVLFPTEEKLNNALDELYRVSKDEIRGTIDRMAQKMYDAEVDRLREKKRKEHEANGEDSNASYYADMAEAHAEASRKREQFKRDATEEYGADLAGRIGEKGFEKMSAEELTFWGKLKAMLQKALQKLLDGLKIPGKRKWSDKDWAFVLHEAYKRKKNGGKPTVFDAADTEVMRRKTGFGDTKFSDGKNKTSEPKPIGHSTFGSVYNQFKGKVLQAVKFLVNHESGDLLGVFHRNDVGDIDMVWGNEGGGLCHILNKHINDKDFPTVKDLVSRIEDIINKGEVDERHSNADKLVLVKDGYLVTIRRNVREKGIKIADKNWVLTAYNKDAPATTKAPVDGTYGSTAVAPGTSSDAKLATKSEINEFSDNNVADEGIMFRDGDSVEYNKAMARDIYEQRVSRGMYQMQEALQDSILGLKEAMDAILKAEGNGKTYIEDVAGYENAYLGENRLSSVNQAECTAFAQTLFKPMLEEVAKLAKTADERAELTDYMMAKHGLERNEVMARRAAEKDARSEFFAEVLAAQQAVDNDPLDQDAIDAFEDVKQRMQDREEELYLINRERDYAGLTALTGMDNVLDAETEAQQMVSDYERDHWVDGLWDKVNAVTKATLQKTYESGLINKATYDDISGMYENYIPLRGFDDKTSDEAYAYLTDKHSAFNAPIKTAKGRKSKADDPFANMEAMAESAIMQGNRNTLVKQKFLNFALNHPSDLVSVSDLWLWHNDVADEWQPINSGDLQGTERIEEDDSPAEVERKMRDFEYAMQQAAKNDPAHFRKQKDNPAIPYRVVESRDLRQHQVLVKRNGRDIILTINGNPRAAQALNGQTNPDNDVSGAIGAIMRLGETVNRQLSAFYTTRNPDFVVSNFMRDMMYANTMVWVKESPNYAWRFHKNVAKVNPAKMKVLLAKLRNGTLDLNDETEKMFHLFMMNGGETGYANIRDIEQRKNDIKRELKKSNGQMPIRKAWDLLGERLDEYNRAVENCARFAAFMTSRQLGRTIDRSVYDAKEISVNFNKKGSGAKFMGAVGQTKTGNAAAFVSGLGRSFYVFWNAALQGSTNFGRQFKRHPKKAIAGAAAMFLLGALMASIGGGDGDDDKEDKNDYFNLPEYVRRSNVVFRLPGMDKSWISMPLPVEYRAMYGMGELMVSAMSGKEHYTAGGLAHQMASQVSQMLPIDLMEGSGGFKAFVPSAIKPIAEVIGNESWTGMPIYKDTPFNKDMPEWTKAYKSANKYLVGLSKALNEATGGDAYTSGKIDINPAQVEYLLNGIFGGVSSTIDRLTKMGETVIGDREYDPRSFLLLNRLVKNGDERTEYRAVNNEYFRIKEESEKLRTRLNHYENDTADGVFDYAEKIAWLNNSPEYRILETYEDYSGDIDDINEELKAAASDEERKKLEAELNETKKELVDAVNNIRNGKQQ